MGESGSWGSLLFGGSCSGSTLKSRHAWHWEIMRIPSWPKNQLIARNFGKTICEADETQWLDGRSLVILVPKQMPAPRHASSPAPKHTALGGGSKAPKGLNLGTVNWELLANLFKSVGFDWQVLMKSEMASFCSF